MYIKHILQIKHIVQVYILRSSQDEENKDIQLAVS